MKNLPNTASSSLYTVIGLMSGTSMDGIDAALVQTDGETIVKPIERITIPFESKIRTEIRNVIAGNGNKVTLEHELTLLHAKAIKLLLTQCNKAAQDIDLIGFHGQTIDHRPHEGITVQIGDGPLLAKETGIPVVYNFRSADIKAGGQGAPLAPVYHRALTTECKKPVAVVNIGGVGNVTWIGEHNEMVAFDTGPGNALIDDYILKHTGNSHDEGGQLASKGKVSEEILATLLAHPFFSQKPPKSLDRNEFAALVSHVDALSTEDAIATLTAFTARSIAKAAEHFPLPVKAWYITGGGRHNKTMMHMISNAADMEAKPIETLGYNGDSLEAEAFAYMAVRNRKGLPISFATTTGITQPELAGGVFCPV